MSDVVTILHITDLHLGTSDGIPCLTSDELTETFFTNLHSTVLELVDRVDFIVATGDFIDRGEVKHYSDAQRHLRALAEHFNLDKNRIVGCVGNHDYEHFWQRQGKDELARKQFYEFIDDFAAGSEIGDKYCMIYEFDDPAIVVVSLDTTWSSKETIVDGRHVFQPGQFAKEDRDHRTILSTIAKNIYHYRTQCKPCVLLSHYPMSDVPDSTFFTSEVRDLHIAQEFYPLCRELARQDTQAPVICLYGDVHRPFVWEAKGDNRKGCLFQFATSRLDSPREKLRKWNIQPGVRVVQFSIDGSRVDSIRIDYEDTKTQGTWDPQESVWYRKDWDRWYPKGGWRKVKKKAKWKSIKIEKPKVETKSVEDPHSIAAYLDDEIRDRGLCEYGCFTNAEFAKTVHIRMGPVMNNSALVNQAIEHLKSSISTCIEEARPIGFVGLDSWGTWIATELGFRLQEQSFGLTLRGLSDTKIAEDIQYRGTGQRLKKLRPKTIVLVADVTVTFSSADRAKQLLEKCCSFNSNPDFWVASLLSAAQSDHCAHHREAFCKFFEVLGEYPIPVLPLTAFPTKVPRDINDRFLDL